MHYRFRYTADALADLQALRTHRNVVDRLLNEERNVVTVFGGKIVYLAEVRDTHRLLVVVLAPCDDGGYTVLNVRLPRDRERKIFMERWY